MQRASVACYMCLLLHAHYDTAFRVDAFQDVHKPRIAYARAAPLQLRGGARVFLKNVGPDITLVQKLDDNVSRLFDILLYISTVLGSLGGTLSAGMKEMDMIGCIILSLVNALGGGTMRDMWLMERPYWVKYYEYPVICIAVSICVFLVGPTLLNAGFRDTHLVLLWTDALCMAVCTIIGSNIGLVRELHPVICVAFGLVTACGGGIFRELLCLEPPRILYAERSMYATPALLGAVVYVAMRSWPCYLSEGISSIVAFVLAVGLRALAWTYRLKTPHWEFVQTKKKNIWDKVEKKIALDLELPEVIQNTNDSGKKNNGHAK